MRAHYLQHVPFEGLGSIEDWLRQAGYEIAATRLYQSEQLPNVEDLDFLVIVGGPMSVNDVNEYPWLDAEKTFIKKAIAAGVPTLGICLGAQLIANSLGGEVYPNSVKEIGWFPIQGVTHEGDAIFRFPEESEVFHWHGETFELPVGAVRLAQSVGCRNQAFQLGSNVIGLQFHLETTPDTAQAIVENCRDELVAGEYIQAETDILSASQDRYESINCLMANILEYLEKSWREASHRDLRSTE
jgi:GMP synthase-like glutamine amidotransferase